MFFEKREVFRVIPSAHYILNYKALKSQMG